ncbi:hypothetical protein GmHk_17G049231 [Glycine max]|nr:hypothetical protein GmHk_17G049231 [Glycine max]
MMTLASDQAKKELAQQHHSLRFGSSAKCLKPRADQCSPCGPIGKARRWVFWGDPQRIWPGGGGSSCSTSNPPPKPGDFPNSDAMVFILVEAVFPATELATPMLLFFRHPPPMGTFRRAPPLVQ